MNNEICPILIIAFSRPSGVKRILYSAFQSGVKEFFVSVDGPRNERDAELIREIYNVVEEFCMTSGCKVSRRFNPNNVGVAVGVISAIDWFFSQVENGIVLEDDLLPGEDFFHFCNLMLTHFSSSEEVWMICGSQFFPNSETENEIVWSHYPMIWGWATWKDRWIKIRKEITVPKRLSWIKILNPNCSYWKVGANRAIQGKVDTWDTPVAYIFYTKRVFAVLPPVNLISNTGNDLFATHTSNEGFPLNLETYKIDFAKLDIKKMDHKKIRMYNHLLDREIFGIRWKHLLLPVFSAATDFIYFPKKKRLDTLMNRLENLTFP